MGLKAENKGGMRGKDVPEAGTHMARLVGLTDMGHQPGFIFKGNEIASAYKIEFTYELPNSLMADGRPHWVSEDVKVNDFETKGGITSTMMARVRTLDRENESEDGTILTNLLGKPCMATISLTDQGYPKLRGQSSISGIPMGMEVPELANDPFTFDMDEPDMGRYNSFPEFKKRRIRESLNFEETELCKALALEDSY